ncbi:glycoside hydrolase [Apiosordaria backusii]|uniref:lytic cellulose monooxygenase (C4-dehydrogenating) n=1 Tax=Apiosordaria backusii TaxID=314023 RepID=A0AA40ETC2_9PEZI|nr:glycoside hydrolase [Apiosordaria backusii]
MRLSVVPLLSFAVFRPANAHYLFGRLILDGKWTKTWEYIREVSPAEGMSQDLALVAPNTNPYSPDLRCGRNASVSWSPVKAATIRAGDTVGFAAGEPMLQGDRRPWMYHPGYASAWLSKSPTDDLNSYTGDGDWFKILIVTGRTERSLDFTHPDMALYDKLKAVWGTYRADSWNFTIPRATPPGKYLLRFEHIFPNKVDAQFYVNCAHVDIVNDRDDVGNPGPVVKIPGVYKQGQPDVYFSTYDFDFNITTFVPPEPAVWSG